MSNARILSAAAVLATAGVASAANITIGPFPLEGSQEVPAVITPASGSATLTLDTVTGDFTLDYDFAGLDGPVTVAHFHNAPAGVNGGVVYWLAAPGAPNNNPDTLLSPPMPDGVTSASASGTGVLSASIVQEILDGNIYINIHSTANGGGELRGQVVPTPAAAGVLGMGALAAARRRRRA
jgi:MYXO-CTERM domain-containing protein